MKIHQIYVQQDEQNPYVDNSYFYILTNANEAIVFDPGVFTPINDFIEQKNLTLKAILNTHHHPDHVGANLELQKKFNCPIYASLYDQQRIPGITNTLTPGEVIVISGTEIKVLDLKAHTNGLIGYYIQDLSALFPGDALFSAGCGRLFEGSPEDLLNSMQTIAKLPLQTKIHCSHEYTLQNLKFALSVDKNNIDLDNYFKVAQDLCSKELPTVPSTLELELKVNPFLRVLDSQFLHKITENDPVVAIKKLRQAKDNF